LFTCVGTRGGGDEGMGPCACPRPERLHQGQAQGPIPSSTLPPVPTREQHLPL